MKPREIPILNNEYKVVVCWGSPKFIHTILNDYKHPRTIDEVNEQCKHTRGSFWHEKCRFGIISLPHKPKTPDEIGTLAHEATHAIENIFEVISEESRDEVFAHSVGAIVREALK